MAGSKSANSHAGISVHCASAEFSVHALPGTVVLLPFTGQMSLRPGQQAVDPIPTNFKLQTNKEQPKSAAQQ